MLTLKNAPDAQEFLRANFKTLLAMRDGEPLVDDNPERFGDYFVVDLIANQFPYGKAEEIGSNLRKAYMQYLAGINAAARAATTMEYLIRSALDEHKKNRG